MPMMEIKCSTKKEPAEEILKGTSREFGTKEGEGVLETERTAWNRTSPKVIWEPLYCSFIEFQEGNKQIFFPKHHGQLTFGKHNGAVSL